MVVHKVPTVSKKLTKLTGLLSKFLTSNAAIKEPKLGKFKISQIAEPKTNFINQIALKTVIPSPKASWNRA